MWVEAGGCGGKFPKKLNGKPDKCHVCLRIFDVGRSQIVGASFGVLAAHSAGEGSQTLPQLVYLMVVSVGAATATTAVSNWLAGNVLKQASLCNALKRSTLLVDFFDMAHQVLPCRAMDRIEILEERPAWRRAWQLCLVRRSALSRSSS